MNILLFAGTGDGRILAERLAALPVSMTVSVATEYGRDLLAHPPGVPVRVLTGRRDAEAILRLVREEGHTLLIDATHPYAVLASANIRDAASKSGVPLLRLSRESGSGNDEEGDFTTVPSAVEGALLVAKTEGNVLLAIGTKELAAFTLVPNFQERLFPRVLPTEEAIRECRRLGFAGSRVIAMQGPFTRELNAALMRQFGIAVLVTKDGGREGGFPEKIQAAEDAGARVVVIGRPEDAGLNLEKLFREVLSRLGGGES